EIIVMRLDRLIPSRDNIEECQTNTTIKVTTATSYDGEQNKTTISTSGTKDTPILAIILGVLGGTILVSAVIGVFVWHSSILSRLGIKRSNRITMISTY
ncbi:unnamed protein product, partial [Rotaria sp. Silwood2]